MWNGPPHLTTGKLNRNLTLYTIFHIQSIKYTLLVLPKEEITYSPIHTHTHKQNITHASILSINLEHEFNVCATYVRWTPHNPPTPPHALYTHHCVEWCALWRAPRGATALCCVASTAALTEKISLSPRPKCWQIGLMAHEIGFARTEQASRGEVTVLYICDTHTDFRAPISISYIHNVMLENLR